MNKERVNRVLDEMSRLGVEQMVITDPYSIYYMAGHLELPWERFWALYLRADGKHKLYSNRLFSLDEVEDVEIVWYSDTEDGSEMLAQEVMHDKVLGIDKGMQAKFLLRLMELHAAADYKNASVCVDDVRASKDEEEKALMREASRVNDVSMEELKTRIKPGMTELELAGQLEAIYKSHGAQGHSFEPLVGFGENAARGHHGSGDTVLKDGDCILIDVGCKKDHYCADMTRTFFFGEVSEAHRKVYETVLRAQLAAEAVIKPGIPLCDIDRAARSVIEEAGYGPYFTHRLGHFIGSEVHEAGDVSAANQRTAKPGMIFSIEPGIYLPDDVGVRIEDLVLVTEDGVEILNHYTKELQVIEKQES
ncbi:MAG: aminopeptidase P family protein [Lachnospiraceae bacterium]|nr:aminopeptidase P family protein [Lachnospiraceae bacterium]